MLEELVEAVCTEVAEVKGSWILVQRHYNDAGGAG